MYLDKLFCLLEKKLITLIRTFLLRCPVQYCFLLYDIFIVQKMQNLQKKAFTKQFVNTEVRGPLRIAYIINNEERKESKEGKVHKLKEMQAPEKCSQLSHTSFVRQKISMAEQLGGVNLKAVTVVKFPF